MASFIDLMGSDLWSDADITNRTESILRAEFSATDEAVLNRKVSGHALGAYRLTEADQAEIARFSAASMEAAAMGVAARADMALLRSALDYEAAQARLARPLSDAPLTIKADEGEIPNPAIQADADERNAAQAVIDGASAETLALVALRNPEPLDEEA